MEDNGIVYVIVIKARYGIVIADQLSNAIIIPKSKNSSSLATKRKSFFGIVGLMERTYEYERI